MTDTPRPSSRLRTTLGSLAVLATALVAGCTDPMAPAESVDVPVELGVSPSPVPVMASASEHACALRATGVVECWGDSSFGEAPAVIEARNGHWFTHVDVSDQHSCAVRSDGVVQCWGSNSFGKAPDSVVAGGGQFVRVAAGGDHTCAVRTDGVIQCWGDNSDGQAPSTRTAGAGQQFVRVTAGLFHTCGLRSGGSLECWGTNFGQAPALRAPSNGSPFVSASSNSGFTCAVRADGVAECFGQIRENGVLVDSVHPGASDFMQVSSGLTHACAVRVDGAIECWGENDHGEAPAVWTAPDGGRFTQVGAGSHFTCAARNNGLVSCIGTHGAPLPAAPGALSTAVVAGRIVVSWPFDPATTSYQIRRRYTNADGSYTAFDTFRDLGRDTTWADTTVIEGRFYQYRVRACASGGCSDATSSASVNAVSAPPAPVPAFGSTAVSGGVVDLSWTDGSSNETRFELQRRVFNDTTGLWSPYRRLVTTPAGATFHRDTTPVRAVRYRYRVRSCNAVGCSVFTLAPSLIAETAGTTPTNVTGAPLPPHQIRLTWSASTNVVTYEIQRRMLISGDTWTTYSLQATVGATGATETWDDTTVVADSVYQYLVRACTSVGCSAYSPRVRVRAP